MVTVFLADGFEEIEAVTPIDILRRGGVVVRTCSITDSLVVTGAHGIPFTADTTLAAIQEGEDVILLPGGMPGTLHLKACEALCSRIRTHHAAGGILAAICAAPTVFGELGLLQNERATCYPGMEDALHCKEHSAEKSVYSGRILTSRGAGTAADFAFRLLEILKDCETAANLSRAMCFEEAEG